MPAADDTLSADGGPREATAATARARLRTGDVLANRYELGAELGHGAFGTVFRARDRVAGIDVAIKVLGRGSAWAVPPERLSRELRAAWTVTHANVVRIHDVIVADDRVALSMELVDGETLAARVARGGKLALAELMPLARGLAAGLAAAHAAGVVHRDLKPSNVLLRPSGEPAIADFGLSRLVGEAGGVRDDDEPQTALSATGDLTQTGELLGTPAFMAPEQLRGETAAVGAASDIYAFGLVMYEAATGERAHRATTLPELVRARLDQPAPAVARARAALAPQLAAVIDACLAIDPAARIADGAALAARLAPPPARATRSRRWLVAVALTAGVVAAAGIAIAIAIATRKPAPRADAPPAVAIHVSATGPIAFSAVVPGTLGAIVQRAVRDPDGTRYVAGHNTAAFAIGDDVTAAKPGLRSGFVFAVAPDGTPRWHREIAGDRDIQLVDMVHAGDLVVVIGNDHGGAELGGGVVLPSPPRFGVVDCYVAAYDAATGVPRWVHTCGATGSGQGRALAADARGNIYAAGEFGGDAGFGGDPAKAVHADPLHRSMFVTSYAPDGTLRWATASGESPGGARGFSLAVRGAADGEILFAGAIAGKTTLGVPIAADDDGDAFVASLDAATGKVVAARTFGGEGSDIVNTVAVDRATGQIVVGGTFATSLAFEPAHPEQRLVSAGSTDVFVAALDPVAPFTAPPSWVVRGGGAQFDGLRGLALGTGASGPIVAVTGRFDLEFGIGDRHVSGAGGNDMFLAELDARTGATRTLRMFGGVDVDRARSVTVLPGGAIGFTGTFRDKLVIGDVTIGAASTTNGFALELRP